MIDLKTVLARVKTLPTLGPVVVQLMSLANNEKASAADFERLIKPDPALTANLLKMANSAYFGCRCQVTSVRQAVAMLGTKRVCETAAGAAFTRVIPSQLKGYGMSAAAYWQHSVAVAVFSERIAKEVGMPVPELTFTAGLLHDIGKLVISSYLEEVATEVESRMRGSDIAYVDAERETLGIDHSQAGAAVAEKWNLPPGIQSAVQWHHAPQSCAEPEGRRLADLVHVADGLSHMMGFGTDQGGLARRIEGEVVERLGLTDFHLQVVASMAVHDIKQLGEVLAKPAGAPA